MSSQQTKEDEQGCNRVFLRLFEDMSEIVNQSVAYKTAQGCTQSEIANKMGVDRAVVTRMLNGTAGTNLRSIAALLYATECRLKVSMVTCEELNRARFERDQHAKAERQKTLYKPTGWVSTSDTHNIDIDDAPEPVLVKRVTMHASQHKQSCN